MTDATREERRFLLGELTIDGDTPVPLEDESIDVLSERVRVAFLKETEARVAHVEASKVAHRANKMLQECSAAREYASNRLFDALLAASKRDS